MPSSVGLLLSAHHTEHFVEDAKLHGSLYSRPKAWCKRLAVPVRGHRENASVYMLEYTVVY